MDSDREMKNKYKDMKRDIFLFDATLLNRTKIEKIMSWLFPFWKRWQNNEIKSATISIWKK